MAVAADYFDTVAETAMAQRLTLKQARIKRLRSASRLAKESGVAASTIIAIERGAVPRLGTVEKLSTALGFEPTEIAWPGDPLGESVDEEVRPNA